MYNLFFLTNKGNSMYAVIDTKGADKICIHIPHKGSEKSLPALAAMLENNAVFLKTGYYDATVVKAEMSIILGDTFDAGTEKPAIVIASNGVVLSDDFEIEAPEVRTSYKKIIEEKEKKIETLSTELKYIKAQLQQAQELLASMEESRAT